MSVPDANLALQAQVIVPPIGGGSVENVSVRAMHDGESIAIRLAWKDPSVDQEVGVSTFRDAAAVGFPITQTQPAPSPFMGDAEHPVAIWQWTADFDAVDAGRGGFAKRYPHTQGIWYFPQDAAVRRQVIGWRVTEPAVEFVATGFGTIAPRPSSRNVRARSARTQDGWARVLTRALATGEAGDPSFQPGETTFLIVAVWDGSHDEVNGRKSVTLAWVPFAVDATVSTLDER